MSDEAFELINCFYDGVDVIVRELAEQIAAKDGQTKQGVLLIEKAHVEQAGWLVLEKLRTLLDDHQIPAEVKERFEGMSDRFASK